EYPGSGYLLVSMASGSKVRAALGAFLLVVCLIAAGCGSSGGGGGGNDKLEVALQDDAVFLQRSYYDRDRALAQAQQMGVTRLRVLLLWARVPGADPDAKSEPAHPKYDWSSYDSLIDDAAKHGIRVQLDISGPVPAWAAGDHKQGIVKPDSKLFGDFVSEAAKHFKGRVDRWSVWNEPNYVGWLAPMSKAPSLYRALYIQAYDAIKKADPNAQVLIAGTAPCAGEAAGTPPCALRREVPRRAALPAPRSRRAPPPAGAPAPPPYESPTPPQAPYPGADNVTVGSLGRLTSALDRLAQAKAL